MAGIKGSLGINTATASAVANSPNPDKAYHYVRRGDEGGVASVVDEPIDELEVERRKALSALTVEEEKKLLHRVDWHLMPLCALLYLIKNLDANSVCLYEITSSYPSIHPPISPFSPLTEVPPGLQCANHEQRHIGEHHDTVGTDI